MTSRTVLLFAIVFGLIAAGTDSSKAEGALAVGLPDRGPGGGFVYGEATDDPNAETTAMSLCRGIDLRNNRVPVRASEAQATCKIVGTLRDQCLAVAYNGTQTIPSTGVGWAIAADSVTAKSRALAQCNDMRGDRGRECVLDVSACDGSAK